MPMSLNKKAFMKTLELPNSGLHEPVNSLSLPLPGLVNLGTCIVVNLNECFLIFKKSTTEFTEYLSLQVL